MTSLTALTTETAGQLDVLGLCALLVMIAMDNDKQDLRMVTRLAWMAQRLVSSNRETR
jgi:hypothetical protein